jgi:hypothetical protein
VQDLKQTEMPAAKQPQNFTQISEVVSAETMSASSVIPASAVEPTDPSYRPHLTPLLELFLRQHPNSHLLSPSDIPDDYSKNALISHESEAFRIADTNQDGKMDVVAIVVKENKFNAVVLQTINEGTSAKAFWLIRDSTLPLVGVFINGEYIVPAYCVGCDTNDTFAWTGSEYVRGVILKGGSVCLNAGSTIYTSADEHSKTVYTTTKLEDAEVLGIGLRNGEYYWHQIKLKSGQTGFALNSTFSFESGLCE